MRNRILLCSVLLVIFTSPTAILAEDDSDLANVYYQSGMSLFKQNKYDEAAEKFNKALSYKKESPQVLFRLGECYEKVNETKKAIDNYRLCQKYLKQQKTTSKEDDQLLTQVCRCIDKLDLNGAEFRKTKNDYLAGLLEIANYCFSKKCQRFTLRLVQNALEIDESNKAAQALLAKIDKNIAASGSSAQITVGPPQELFNGKDIKNWQQGAAEYVKRPWDVTGGRIIGDSKDPKISIALFCPDKPPDEYILTIKFKILKYYLDPAKVLFVVMHGRTNRGSYAGHPIKLSGLNNEENELKVVRYPDKIKLTLNGKNVEQDEEKAKSAIMSIETPQVGISVMGAAISIRKITIQEFKEPTKSKTAEPEKSVQSKKPASAKKGLVKELFNGRDLNDWTLANSETSIRNCWTIRQGKIDVNTKGAENRTVLFYNDPPPPNYKLTILVSIEQPIDNKKESRMGIVYGSPPIVPGRGADMNIEVSSIYFGDGSAKSEKLELVKKGSQYQLIRDGDLFREFSEGNLPAAIGLFAQNTRMTISSITMED